MKVNETLMLGERIELRIEKNDYRSNVQDIIDESTFLVMHPLDQRSIPMHLDMDDVLGVIFFRPNGQFLFRARVQGRARIDGVPMVRLRAETGEPEKFQRRNGFRLDIATQVTMRPLSVTGDLKEVYRIQSLDISDGGMQVLVDQMVPLGTVFEISFRLDEDDLELVELRASVRRVISPEDVEDKRWKLGLEYLNCTDATRRRISRYILREQAARRLQRVL